MAPKNFGWLRPCGELGTVVFSEDVIIAEIVVEHKPL